RVRDALAAVSRGTELAVPTTDSGIDGHTLAGCQSGDTRTELANDPRRVTADNFRQGDFDSRHSPSKEDIDVIDRCRLDFDEHFAVCRLWIGHVFVFENLRTTVLFKNDCFHARQLVYPTPHG